jgi:hypothetical protein
MRIGCLAAKNIQSRYRLGFFSLDQEPVVIKCPTSATASSGRGGYGADERADAHVSATPPRVAG